MQAWNFDGRIAELLGVLAVDEGYSSSLLDGVRFMRANRSEAAGAVYGASRASSSSARGASACFWAIQAYVV